MTPVVAAASATAVTWSTDELRAFLERDVTVAMAGRIAERRSMRGSEAAHTMALTG